jgi:pimeloyl-ACP methyl ester carboxylesterase
MKFLDALGLTRVDVLGFSLGGRMAQMIALKRPAAWCCFEAVYAISIGRQEKRLNRAVANARLRSASY